MLSLTSGGAVCDLLPEVGGAVGRFAVGGREILRPTRAGERAVRQTGCFPLVPFFGRVRDGRIDFRGEHIVLPPDPGFEPNAIHGQGWRNPWSVEESRADAATLSYAHRADAWPWDYAAREQFELTPESLRITLALTNRSRRPMPYSIGFHPYFPRTPETVVRADVAGVWLADENITPTEQAAPDALLDLAHGARLADAPFVDNTHVGWSHRAAIVERGFAVEMSSDADFLHFFVPKAETFFCMEPVSAMPDAFNRQAQTGSGFRVLNADETATVTMTLGVGAQW
jgi:aldose 1-epimerase